MSHSSDPEEGGFKGGSNGVGGPILHGGGRQERRVGTKGPVVAGVPGSQRVAGRRLDPPFFFLPSTLPLYHPSLCSEALRRGGGVSERNNVPPLWSQCRGVAY